MPNFSDYDYRLSSRRNIIINSNFNSWQRGASGFTSGYTADRFAVGASQDGVFNVARSTSVPDARSNYSWLLTQTTGDASLAAGQYSHIVYKVEGYDFKAFVGRPAVLSFWVRATVPGSYTCFFRSSTADLSYVTEYTINSSNTWEYKEVSIIFDYSSGTWDYITGIGLNMGWCIGCGATYKTSSTDQWISGNYIAGSNQVNGIASNNNIFGLSRPQLEIGRVATPFESISPFLEQDLWLRYYQVINYSHIHATGISSGNGTGYSYVVHKRKRAVPTSLGITSPLIWSVQNGWRTPTSTAACSANTERILFVFQDTGVTNYVAGQSLLLIANCAINAEL